MGMDHHHRQWIRRCVGPSCTQNSTITHSRIVVVHRCCSIHCVCAGSHWRCNCEQRKNGVSCVPCFLWICLHHGCGDHLLLPPPTQRSRVFAVRLWRFVLDGLRHSSDAGGPISLKNGKILRNSVVFLHEEILCCDCVGYRDGLSGWYI